MPNSLSTIPIALLILLAVASACSSARETNPDRTATEQLLISTAAERSARRLDLDVPQGTRVFVSADYLEGTDSKYALGAVRDRLLRQGMALVPKREDAEAVVEVRAGALSIDESDTLVGIRSFDIPIPLAGPLTLPEIALFKRVQRQGVARLAATSYGTADGRLIDSADPQFGYAHKKKWVVLLFLSWWTSDLPDEDDDDLLDRF